jgi:ribosomal peptide maturation radical SAM protein 1
MSPPQPCPERTAPECAAPERTAPGRAAVVLVAAPFFSVVRPALGISTLQAALAARGIAATTSYLNIRLADDIGPDLFQYIAEQAQTSLLLGEWVFSEALGFVPPAEIESAYMARAKSYAGAYWPRIVAARRNARAFIERCARELAATAPRIVGFSTTFQQNCASLAIARRLKALAPEIAVCFGGANCDGPMGAALLEQFGEIDFVFRGEADASFPDFVERYLAGRRPYARGPDVLGHDGIDAGEATAPIDDLDRLPIPDFTDYFSALAASRCGEQVVPALPFESSRGCWWGMKHHCTFCGLNGSTMTFRTKSAERVVAELDTLHARWGIARFHAADNILNMKHVDDVFGRLAKRDGPRFNLFYEIKSNMRPAQVEAIARGGVTWVQPGIEHLDDHVLKLMDKGVSGLQNIRLLRTCWEIGVRPIWNVLCGFPGERPGAYRDMAARMRLLSHLQPPTGHCRIRLDRFSPYFERAEAFGFRRVEPAAAYRAVYGLPAPVLERLAYFFDGVAENSATDADLAPVAEAIAAWQHAYFGAGGPPMLVSVVVGPLMVVKDTRAIARDAIHVLDDCERRLLDACREPVRIAAAIGRLVDGGSDRARLEVAHDELAGRGFLLVDGDTAVSLVCDTALQVIDDDRRADFPGGWLRTECGRELMPLADESLHADTAATA